MGFAKSSELSEDLMNSGDNLYGKKNMDLHQEAYNDTQVNNFYLFIT